VLKLIADFVLPTVLPQRLIATCVEDKSIYRFKLLDDFCELTAKKSHPVGIQCCVQEPREQFPDFRRAVFSSCSEDFRNLVRPDTICTRQFQPTPLPVFNFALAAEP
jgi:hypothetical protein